jgi:hypothetical protein
LNKKKKAEGQEVDHSLAKELLAGFASASVDRFVETKGLSWLDKEKAKHQAKKEAQALYTKETGYAFD